MNKEVALSESLSLSYPVRKNAVCRPCSSLWQVSIDMQFVASEGNAAPSSDQTDYNGRSRDQQFANSILSPVILESNQTECQVTLGVSFR